MKTKLISFALGVVCGVALVAIWQGRYDYPGNTDTVRYDKWTQTPQIYAPTQGWVGRGKKE